MDTGTPTTDKLLLEVVTPEQLVLSEEVDEVTAAGVEGDFGVLPGHINFLTSLRPGTLAYRIGTSTQRIDLTGGIAEVLNNRVTILAAPTLPQPISIAVSDPVPVTESATASTS